MDIQNQLNLSGQNFLTDEDRKNLIINLNLNDLPEDQKQKAVDEIMEKVITRIAYVLVEEDIKTLEELGKNENSLAVRYFLLAKIPNFEKIFQEEAEDYKTEDNSS